jgi:hypothetical protein
MSCSDILLSFLADVGEDWTDSFIFPDSETSIINVDDFLSNTDYVPNLDCNYATLSGSTDSESIQSMTVSDSTDSEDKDFQYALDLFEFADDNFSVGISTDEMFGEIVHDSAICASTPEFSRKRKLDESPVFVVKTESILPVEQEVKKIKITVNDQIRDVCGLLKQYKVIRDAELLKQKLESSRRYKFTNSVGTAEAYLNAIFGSTAATPQALLKLACPTSKLQCKALSSLVNDSSSKKSRMKLSAWAPIKSHASAFPESHAGVGQIAAASRAFVSSLSEILSHSILSKLKFSAHIIGANAVISKHGDQLSAPFHWRSQGMVALGYPAELEFNGLIRCSFVREGVSSASVSFDACRIVRQQSELLQPQVAA